MNPAENLQKLKDEGCFSESGRLETIPDWITRRELNTLVAMNLLKRRGHHTGKIYFELAFKFEEK